MAYRDDQHEEDDEANLDDREDPDESDITGGDDPEHVPCPYCGREVYEGAEICPHCGNYISSEDAPRRRPRWAVVAVVVCLVIALICVVSYV